MKEEEKKRKKVRIIVIIYAQHNGVYLQNVNIYNGIYRYELTE